MYNHMADIEPQQANHLPGNSFPNAAAVPPQPQQQDHVLHNIHAGIPSVIHTGQLEGQWEDVPPAVVPVHGTVQGTLRNPHHINVANHGMADYPELPEDLTGPYTYPDVGLSQGFRLPEHAQGTFPANQGNVSLGYVPQDIVLGPTQAAHPDSSTHQTPILGQPAAENFRRLANRYVNHPDSEVVMVRMEPGSAGRYKVVIVLEMADFL